MKPKSPDKKMFSLKRLKKSFQYAINGIINSFKTEQNLIIHFLMLIIVLVCSFLFKISKIELLIIILISTIVISLELVNTAIENAIDNVGKVSKEARLAKDAASGAVLIAAISSIIVGLIIFLPKIISLFTK